MPSKAQMGGPEHVPGLPTIPSYWPFCCTTMSPPLSGKLSPTKFCEASSGEGQTYGKPTGQEGSLTGPKSWNDALSGVPERGDPLSCTTHTNAQPTSVGSVDCSTIPPSVALPPLTLRHVIRSCRRNTPPYS